MSRSVDRRTLLGAALLGTAATVLDACRARPSSAARSSTTPDTTSVSVSAPTTSATTTTTTAVALSSPTTNPAPASADPAAADAPAQYVNHAPSDAARAALTFHLGGDRKLVVKLLDLLHERQLHITAFAIGTWLEANPDLGHRAVDDGHELGNHTNHHLSMLQLSRAQVRSEIVDGGQALVPFIGSIGKWFRPSGTDVPNQVILDEAGRAGYPVSVGYDIDSRDYTNPGARVVVSKVNAAMHPGAIVSLHFGHSDTIVALPAILDHMGSVAITPCTVSELLG